MVSNISTQMHIARKQHHDDSAEFIIEAMDFVRHGHIDCGRVVKMKFNELRAVARLKANNWKIQPGELYEKQYNKVDGQVYTFKTLPQIGKICSKYKLYYEG